MTTTAAQTTTTLTPLTPALTTTPTTLPSTATTLTAARQPGLKLRNDYHVRYYKSRFNGKPCIDVDWSAIDHIFVKEDNAESNRLLAAAG